MNRTRNLLRLQHVIEGFFTTWALMKIGRFEPGNIITVVFFLLSLFFYRYLHLRTAQTDTEKLQSMRRSACILSLLFTTMYMAVDYLAYIDALTNRLFQAAIILVVFLGLFILFYKLLLLCFLYMVNDERLMKHVCKPDTLLPFYRKHIFCCTVLCCLICWLPYFLYQYPGIMTPDSINQFEQALGIIPYSNHHPWMHTLLIKLWYHIGLLFTDDLVVAFSFYTAFQMILLACSIGYLLTTLAELRLNTVLCLIATAFYALVPYHAVYSVTVWKDIPFAAGVLSFSCSLFLLSRRIKVRDIVIYFLAGFMFCLFRSNGWYAFLICFPFLLYHFRNRAKLMIPLHLCLLLCVLIIKIPVMNSCHVAQPDFVESISIPIQQVAAVICNDRPLTDEQRGLIEKVIDLTYIKELYVPTFADNMKELVRAGNPDYLESHKGEYFRLWLTLLKTYPHDYIHAYIMQTNGYWYPDSFYPVADNEGVSATSLGVSHTPLIGGPIVVKAKEISLKLGGMVPLYGLLWSMGIASWVLLFCIGSAFVRNEKEKLVYYLPSFSLLLTVLIATPVASDFRYLYFLFLTLPLCLFIAVEKRPAEEQSENYSASNL